jgi:hypothetical protein
MADLFTNKIGFLPCEKPIQFNNGRLSPLEEYNEILAYVNDEANKDGYYYPPLMHTVSQRHEVVNGQLEIKEEIVPKSTRPAHLFKMPASHNIEIINPVSVNDPKVGDGLFLTYLVAFHFGIRLQFHDWWFDMRVPVKIDRDFYADHSQTEVFINNAYENWCSATEDGRTRLTNLLFMQSRAKSYEWDWERFLIYYMVLDGCYNYLNTYFGVVSRTHAGRIKAIIDYFNMHYDQIWIDRIVDLRNDLFHETLWGGGQPCNSNATHSWEAAFHLPKFNSRLISAILGHEGKYIQASWVSRSMFSF